MSARCGSSRTLGPLRQCAIFARDGIRCVWCCAELERGKATIDHLDGVPSNNDPTNLVSSCNGCNVARFWDWGADRAWCLFDALAFAWSSFPVYVDARPEVPTAPLPARWQEWRRERPATVPNREEIETAILRAEHQRYIPIDLVAARALAEEWHGERLRYMAQHSKRRHALRRASARP